MITSELALLYVYAIFLIGVEDIGVELPAMRQAIAELFFMATMISRYAFSGETRLEVLESAASVVIRLSQHRFAGRPLCGPRRTVPGMTAATCVIRAT